jgi:hypothetical protein
MLLRALMRARTYLRIVQQSSTHYCVITVSINGIVHKSSSLENYSPNVESGAAVLKSGALQVPTALDLSIKCPKAL